VLTENRNEKFLYLRYSLRIPLYAILNLKWLVFSKVKCLYARAISYISWWNTGLKSLKINQLLLFKRLNTLFCMFAQIFIVIFLRFLRYLLSVSIYYITWLYYYISRKLNFAVLHFTRKIVLVKQFKSVLCILNCYGLWTTFITHGSVHFHKYDIKQQLVPNCCFNILAINGYNYT